MLTIYLDADYKCHISNDGTMRAFEVSFFDGKCAAFIEGHRYVPEGETWTRSDGKVFGNGMLTPWRDLALLEKFQAQYEAQLAAADAAYQEGVNTAYD